MSLKDIPIRLSYKSKGEENLLDAFLIPALRQSVSYKRSVGFFSSTVFEIIGVGITQLIDNGGSIQIICSPELREEDIEAIHLGIKMKKAVAEQSVLEDLEKCLDAVSDENLKMLIELIKNDQLNIMVVEVDDKLGIYHDKIGIIKDSDGNKVLFIGSPNESKNAYCGNYEKIRISVSWNENDIARIQDDEEEFDDIWNGTHEFISGVDCTSLVGRKLKQELYKRKSAVKEISKEGVNLRTYQKEAIKAWLDNNKHGFFVMATGTGKTWTAIYAALEVIKQENIFLAICAPYKHLVRQWYEDVHKVLPDNQIIMVSSENNDWEKQLLDAIYNSKYLNGGTVIAISTIVSFNLKKFERVVSKTKMKRMLIVDEAHRFKNTSEQIQKKYAYMLGLSATPFSKKNDEIGESLMNFFGGQVYNLPIEYAIEHNYLVQYNYFPIYVNATYEEERNFERYTSLMASCFRNNICIDLENLAKYKRGRLRVISMAQEKIDKISWILDHIKEKNHFIVYCGDGRLFDGNADEGKKYIQYVQEILKDRGLKVNQFTAEENMKERMQLVNSFNKGMIDSLVAIRCLDEGINIPSIEGALLLSSNDDYREFVQRRGRILRTYINEYTGQRKKESNIYDVVVLPSDKMSNFALIELRRFYEYARLAKNAEKCIQELEDLAIRYGLDMEIIMQTEDNEGELDE
jgi:superfamily II DNA or RNA helicase